MTGPAIGQPNLFVPTVSIYDNNGVLREVWRIFFQTLINRTGGNTSTTVTINDLFTTENGTTDLSQRFFELAKRVALLETNDGFALAIMALEQSRSNGISAAYVMAVATLGIM